MMRDISALVQTFREAGFTLVREKNHQIWRCPCGHTQMTSSLSQHGGRGDQNARARIARALKICQQNMENAA
jgi:hypothetical protein